MSITVVRQHAYGLSCHQWGTMNGEWFIWAHATNGDRYGLLIMVVWPGGPMHVVGKEDGCKGAC